MNLIGDERDRRRSEARQPQRLKITAKFQRRARAIAGGAKVTSDDKRVSDAT